MTEVRPPEGWLCASCARFEGGGCPYFQNWTRHRTEPPPIEECSAYLPLPEPGKGPDKPPKGTPIALPTNGSGAPPDPFPTDTPSSSNSTDSSDTVPTPKEA